MATKSKTTYIHTCDLCGTEHSRRDLRRFGLVAIRDAIQGPRRPEIEGPHCDVCPACQQRPIADLLARLEGRETQPSQPGPRPGTDAREARGSTAHGGGPVHQLPRREPEDPGR
jgi:hypothetical protein